VQISHCSVHAEGAFSTAIGRVSVEPQAREQRCQLPNPTMMSVCREFLGRRAINYQLIMPLACAQEWVIMSALQSRADRLQRFVMRA
jgi:hypothetical protein